MIFFLFPRGFSAAVPLAPQAQRRAGPACRVSVHLPPPAPLASVSPGSRSPSWQQAGSGARSNPSRRKRRQWAGMATSSRGAEEQPSGVPPGQPLRLGTPPARRNERLVNYQTH